MENAQWKLPLVLAASSLALAVAAPSGWAQDPEDLPVRERPHPEYDAIGLRQGNVFFYPSIGVSEAYNDNVFASENNREGDFITVISPSLTVQSDGTQGGWQARLNGGVGLHASETDRDYTDLSASLDGRYEALPGGTFSLGAGFARAHEDSSSPDEANALEPTVYYRADARAGYRQRFNRLTVGLNLSAHDYTFNNGDSTTGTVDNDDRDRLVTEEALRLSYDIMPGYAVFVRGALNQRTYDEARDRSGIDRDSDGYDVSAGIAVDLTGLLTLELSAGYLSQDYDDPQLSRVDGVAASAKAIWNVTRLTTVTATIDRDVEETTLNGASGRLDTLGRLEIDHELRRNIILSAGLGYQESDFQGIPRVDELFDASVSVDYLLSPGLSLSARGTHLQRESNAAGADFSRNVVLVRLRYGL